MAKQERHGEKERERVRKERKKKKDFYEGEKLYIHDWQVEPSSGADMD